ncbi:TPA: hypothetical protein ACH3X1_005998 [Trebouxia sp. C0004]
MALFMLSEEGKAKKDSIYSVVCNPRHAVKPFLRDSDLDNLVFSNPDFVLELTEVQKGLALLRTVPFAFTEGRFKQMAPAIPSHPIPQPQRDAGKKGRPLRAQDHAIYASSTPARPDRHGGSVPATPSSQGLQLQQDVGKKAASPRTQNQTTNASDSLIRPDRTVIEKYIQGMAALAFTETGKQKLSQLYDSAATPNQPVHPFLGDEDILTLALRNTCSFRACHQEGLACPTDDTQCPQRWALETNGIAAHLRSQAGADQTVRPNGREKAGCAPGPDLTKSQQSEARQEDAAGSKQKPTSKAQRQSQRLKEKPEPPKRQKQNNNRTRVADESHSDGLGMLVAAAELDDEAEISSTTSSDANGHEEPQELYDSGSGRD